MIYAELVAETVRLLLRLPPDLHAALVVMAQREQRSLHGQIVYLLRRAVERNKESTA